MHAAFQHYSLFQPSRLLSRFLPSSILWLLAHFLCTCSRFGMEHYCSVCCSSSKSFPTNVGSQEAIYTLMLQNGVSVSEGFILSILPDGFLMLLVTAHLVNKDLSCFVWTCSCTEGLRSLVNRLWLTMHLFFFCSDITYNILFEAVTTLLVFFSYQLFHKEILRNGIIYQHITKGRW